MSTVVPNGRMSGVDAAFLYLERKEIPLHIASVSIFDGPIAFEKFVATIESRLPLLPRYQQVVVPAPYGIGHPIWQPDPHFDIRRHIFAVTLDAPGGEAELQALASRILTERMDRSKPLWDIYLVDGLKGGRGALIARIHHALADGVSGAALLNVMFDSTPEVRASSHRRRARAPEVPASEYSIAEALGNALHSSLESLKAAESGVSALLGALRSGDVKSKLQSLLTVLPELAAPVERLPFNRPCGGGRTFCWTEMELADMQAVRAASGGKINDLILTIVTRATAAYVKLHGETVVNRHLRVVCPVSIRDESQNGTLGNRITFLPVVLPMDVRDPVDHLHAIAMRMDIMKSAHVADMVGLAASCIGAAPPPLQSLFWTGLPMLTLPVPLFNMICTNVPGSPTPLYTAGRRMLAAYPHVPTGYDLGVGIAAHTYDGKVFFGLTADTEAAPDVERLRDALYDAFRELCRASGVKVTHRRAQPGRKSRKRREQARAAEPMVTPRPQRVRTARKRVHNGPETVPEAAVAPAASPAPEPVAAAEEPSVPDVRSVA